MRAESRYRGRSVDERREERERRLLDAALELMGGEPGYRGTTVAVLCGAAGLSTRQFYEHFRTLEEVLTRLYTSVNERAEAAVLEALGALDPVTAPLADRVRAGLGAYARVTAGDARWAQIAYVQIVGVNPTLERLRADRRAHWAALLAAEADQAADRGEVSRRDWTLTTAAFIGAVNALLHDWAAGYVTAGFDEVVAELTDLLLARLTY
ncbi:TetR/AcrR family transcriptional regulator [Streptomyces sp. SP17BM10]|uniref:TetR/AcrR family transcriptional regulator n=1 Tax=Streptomyces sp. SP17BM10 TaxID=3002530 RepID=UPI002E796B61|nr:TetR/AcrR family transcriptional regulator [Streptomyces sp. SP17BM10]